MCLPHSFLFCAAAALLSILPAGAQDQQPTPPTIRAESRVVLVDAVVTDKKGNYIRDLTGKDFRIWEDNKEQSITSFSFEADAASSARTKRRYMVLLFDDASMQPGDQMQARQAALKFIGANAGPDRVMAVMDYTGTLKIAQNFTADSERLKKVVNTYKISSVSSNAPADAMLTGGLANAAADFGANTSLMALRSVARSLASIPGRKSLIWLSSGFPYSIEGRGELGAVLDACNKANVAVYPIDVRGLTTSVGLGRSPGGAAATPAPAERSPVISLASAFGLDGAGRVPRFASFLVSPVALSLASGAPPAGGGGGGMGGGGGRGAPSAPPGGNAGGGSAGRGSPGPGAGNPGKGGAPGNGSGGNPGVNRGGNPGGNPGVRPGMGGSPNVFSGGLINSPRTIIPNFPVSAADNQQIMYMLANGTGGFVISNTNDLLGGMTKIAQEQNEYYLLGYTPAESADGSCHTLRVKVDRGGATMRARSGYCNVRSNDLLAGNSEEKALQSIAAGTSGGNLKAVMQVPFFYTAPNTAVVTVAVSVPSNAFHFEKEKGKFQSAITILGIAYRKNGEVAARFSDRVEVGFKGKKEAQEFNGHPFSYQNQFTIAPGEYDLKVAFSSGGANFGRIERPLSIDPYDPKQFSMSAVALSNSLHQANGDDSALDAAMVEDRKTLVSHGIQIVPSGTNRFSKTDMVAAYIEVYDPKLVEPAPPQVGVRLRILDAKTGESKVDKGFGPVTSSMVAGNPMIPVAYKLPVADLAPGLYKAEMTAMDSNGQHSAPRLVEFELEELPSTASR